MKKVVSNLDQCEIETTTKAELISELKEAIQELKAIEQGNKKARPLADLLKEL